VIGIMAAVATPTEPVIQVDDDLSLPQSVVEDLVARKERASQEPGRHWKWRSRSERWNYLGDSAMTEP